MEVMEFVGNKKDAGPYKKMLVACKSVNYLESYCVFNLQPTLTVHACFCAHV